MIHEWWKCLFLIWHHQRVPIQIYRSLYLTFTTLLWHIFNPAIRFLFLSMCDVITLWAVPAAHSTVTDDLDAVACRRRDLRRSICHMTSFIVTHTLHFCRCFSWHATVNNNCHGWWRQAAQIRPMRSRNARQVYQQDTSKCRRILAWLRSRWDTGKVQDPSARWRI